jgi:hypothetical protein
MLKKLVATTSLGAIIALSGCAAIITGQTQQISVNSNVRGASVLINGKEVGKTPFVGVVQKPKAGDGNTITLRAEGYQEKTIAVGSSIEPTFWVNILSGGPFGSTTDYAAGSMYKLGDGAFQIDMDKVGK